MNNKVLIKAEKELVATQDEITRIKVSGVNLTLIPSLEKKKEAIMQLIFDIKNGL